MDPEKLRILPKDTVKPTYVDIPEGGGLPSIKGVTLSCHDIKYQVRVPQACGGKIITKQILKGVSGIFKPGLNAILGPTGCGKTSILDVMAARKDPRGLTGTVLIDGRQQPSNFKCMSGYVSQDDHILGTLTVRENLMFSANLRLPETTSHEDKVKQVDETVKELGLTECQHTRIGNDFIRGVSGGERKRTNIGMELIISPSVIFLDEPTTGLDASTANAVLTLLHRLGRKGRTIIFSIHQPRYSIFRLFDRLTLMSFGNLVYQGPGNEALDFFASIGYVCETHNNPPDYFLDVLNGDSTAVASTKDDTALEVVQMKSEDPDQKITFSQQLLDQFKKSTWYNKMMGEVEPLYQEYQKRNGVKGKKGDDLHYATGLCAQLRYVCHRAARNTIRNPTSAVLQVAVMIFFALLVGTVYWNLDDSYTYGTQNRSGAFLFILMIQLLGTMASLELFIQDRKLFLHETSNGFYRVSVYFFSKLVCDIIPVRFCPVVVFTAITYYMIDLRHGADHFFIFMVTVYMMCIASVAMAFFFSAVAPVVAIANIYTSMAMVIMIIFGGLLINIDSIHAWLRWLQYISFFRYAMNALSVNEMKDQVYCDYDDNNTAIICEFGNTYLDAQGIDFSDDWDIWKNQVYLSIFAVIFFVMAYVKLRIMNKYT